jgi:hypothetical protein
MNYEIVDEYAAMMKRGVDFDPIAAIYSKAENRYYAFDGAHRTAAALQANVSLHVAFENGNREDAEWLALSANQKHGLRRSTKDKQRVVRNALLMKGTNLSDREIGRHCGVDHKTVGRLRKELEASGEIPQIDERTVIRNGQSYQQKAKKPKPPIPVGEITGLACDKCDTTEPSAGAWEYLGPQRLCKTCFKQELKAKETPTYATIWELESLVRGWLSKVDQSQETDILSEIKTRSKRGQGYLSSLSDYVRRILDAPHRKGDLRQACNNVLDQLNQDAWRQKRNEHLATLTCLNCGEQTIEAIGTMDAIRCTTCGNEWNCVADFERDKAAYEAVRENATSERADIEDPEERITLHCTNCGFIAWHNPLSLLPVNTNPENILCFKCRQKKARAAKAATEPSIFFASLPCPRCEKMKIEITAEKDNVLCHHCGAKWDGIVRGFHRERDEIKAYAEAAKRAAEQQPTATPVTMRAHWSCGRCDKTYPPGTRYNVPEYDKGICAACLDEIKGDAPLGGGGAFFEEATAQPTAETEAQAQYKYHYSAYTLHQMKAMACLNCGEQAVEPTDEFPAIHCTKCKTTWPRLSIFQDIAFKQKTTATAPPCPAHAYDPAAWVEQYTQGVCPACLRKLGGAMIQAAADEDDRADPLSRAEAGTMRFDLKSRLRRLVKAIPDEDLASFETWVESVEEMMTPTAEPA